MSCIKFWGEGAMDLSHISLFRLIQEKMGFLAQRQDVLAENIANIDTPGYRPKDINVPNFLDMATSAATRLELRATQPNHLPQMHGNGMMDYPAQGQRKVYEIKPVGNSVIMEEQMKKVALNSADYQLVTNVYKKIGDLLKRAVSNQ